MPEQRIAADAALGGHALGSAYETTRVRSTWVDGVCVDDAD